MDGIHDMGSMHGFGRVPLEQDTVFTHDWQKRAFALTEALAWSVPFCADEHRHSIERIAPADYLNRDYFEKWVIGVQTLLQEAGLVDCEELVTGQKRFDIVQESHPAVTPKELIADTKAGAALSFAGQSSAAKFNVGQTVRVGVDCPAGHTRVPRYVRNRIGKIVKDLGVFQFADAVAAKLGPCPQHCSTVEFDARSLWGADAEENQRLYVDLWEAYLERH
ncbi:MAG: nitrile hydratase [Pseudorhodobacter sp.]|jgi:nitrile hydratase beta subunit